MATKRTKRKTSTNKYARYTLTQLKSRANKYIKNVQWLKQQPYGTKVSGKSKAFYEKELRQIAKYFRKCVVEAIDAKLGTLRGQAARYYGVSVNSSKATSASIKRLTVYRRKFAACKTIEALFKAYKGFKISSFKNPASFTKSRTTTTTRRTTTGSKVSVGVKSQVSKYQRQVASLRKQNQSMKQEISKLRKEANTMKRHYNTVKNKVQYELEDYTYRAVNLKKVLASIKSIAGSSTGTPQQKLLRIKKWCAKAQKQYLPKGSTQPTWHVVESNKVARDVAKIIRIGDSMMKKTRKAS